MPAHLSIAISDGIFTAPKTNPNATLVIAHGVNTHGLMGAGIARQVAHRYPSILPAYRETCRNGTLTQGKTLILRDDSGVFIANIASQDAPGANAREEWLREGLMTLYRQIAAYQIAMFSTHQPVPAFEVRTPLIGGGIGGIDPVRAANILFDCADKAHNVHGMLLPIEAPNRPELSTPTTLYLRPGGRHNAAVTQAFDTYYDGLPRGKYHTL